MIGFLYYCLRLGWIKSNPAVLLGRIRADGPPTDYFPAPEFDKIMDATYIYQPKGWVECRNQATLSHGQARRYVQQGMKIGSVTDLFGKTVWEARAPSSGVVLYVCAVPSMKKGETVANIGVVAGKAP